MMECELCHDKRATQTYDGLAVCYGCAEQLAYLDNLTPEERILEDLSIARYVDETREWQ